MGKQQQSQMFTVDGGYLRAQALDAMRAYFEPLKGIVRAVKGDETSPPRTTDKPDD